MYNICVSIIFNKYLSALQSYITNIKKIEIYEKKYMKNV